MIILTLFAVIAILWFNLLTSLKVLNKYVLFQFVLLFLRVESTSFYSKLTEIIIVYHSVTIMNSQLGSINEQTSRSLVEREDPIVQSGTSGVGPSTGQEDRRVGASGPGTSESSVTEARRKMKTVKLPGNNQLSLAIG